MDTQKSHCVWRVFHHMQCDFCVPAFIKELYVTLYYLFN